MLSVGQATKKEGDLGLEPPVVGLVTALTADWAMVAHMNISKMIVTNRNCIDGTQTDPTHSTCRRVKGKE